MSKLRLRFSKTGKAKYISHLDLMATMRRAFLRAGVELNYSLGFNPHPYMSVALPLSVGCESVCELMDFEPSGNLETEGLPALVNNFLPEGILVDEAYISGEKFSKIAWLEVKGSLYYDSKPSPDILERLYAALTKESVVISKRTKRGMSDIDIAPFIKDLEFYEENGILMKAVISAQNPSLSPDNLVTALESAGIAPDYAVFRRTNVYDEKMDKFI